MRQKQNAPGRHPEASQQTTARSNNTQYYTRQHAITANVIPNELRVLPNWLAFRTEWRTDEKTGERKLGKTPVDGASSTDPATWRSLDQAGQIIQRGRGGVLGFALPADRRFTGIDLDYCLAPQTGALKAWAVPLLAPFIGRTHIERTPSGEGLRIWVQATKKGTRCKQSMPNGGAVEVYDHERLFTVTGNAYEQAPATIAPMQAELDALYDALFPAAERKAAAPASVTCGTLSMDDEELLMRARNNPDAAKAARFCALFDAGDTSGYNGDHSAADQALCNDLAYMCGPGAEARVDTLFRRSALMREKWETRADYREWTISRAFDGRAAFYTPPAPKHNPHVNHLELHGSDQTSDPLVNQDELHGSQETAAERAAEIAEMRRRIQEIETENATLRMENQALRDANVRMNEKLRWVDQVMALPSDRLSTSEKCVAIAVRRSYERNEWKRDDRGYYEPYMPKLAAAAGVSESTAGKALVRLGGDDAAVKPIDRQERKVATPQGMRTHVKIAIVPDVLENPESWMPAGGPREHGGKREGAGRPHVCPECGSEHVSQRKVRQIIERTIIETRCQDCGTVSRDDTGAERVIETKIEPADETPDETPHVNQDELHATDDAGDEEPTAGDPLASVEASSIGLQVEPCLRHEWRSPPFGPRRCLHCGSLERMAKGA